MEFAYTDYQKLKILTGFENFNQTLLQDINDKNALLLIDKFIESHNSSPIFI
jgi:hypothetical protein